MKYIQYMFMLVVLFGCGGRDNPYEYARSNQYQSEAAPTYSGIELFCNCSYDQASEVNNMTDGNGGEILDGVILKIPWRTIEPAQGKFNWDLVDTQIEAARRNHMRVTLAVTVGPSTPEWLESEGAQFFVYSAEGAGDSRFPLPWDSVYISRYSNLIDQLGSKYDGNSTIKRIRITNTSTTGYEMGFKLSDSDEARLRMNGFNEEKMLSSWVAVINAYSNAFTRTSVDVSVQPIFGDSGLAYSVVDYGMGIFGHRFGIFSNWDLHGDTFGQGGELLDLIKQVSASTFLTVEVHESLYDGSEHETSEKILNSLRNANREGIKTFESDLDTMKNAVFVDAYRRYVREESLMRIAH